MPWLKRNLFLVIGGLVAIGLLGFAGYFLFNKIQRNQEVTAQLEEKTQLLKDLVGRDPHPGTEKVDNIGAAKREVKKVQAFLSDVQQYFPPAPTETNRVSSQQFRVLLENAIDELQRGAERAGVKVPDDYWFTFSAQKTAMSFATNVVGSLAGQLSDIKALCEILYQAKVVSLLGLRRMPVASEDSGSQDYLSSKGTTNNWTVSTPYEVTFQGFSSELASVLEGLIRSKNCFVVRNISVDRADSPQEQETITETSSPQSMSTMEMMAKRYGLRPGMGANPYGGGQGMSPELRSRYGLAPAPPPPTQPATHARAAGKGGMTVFLEEKALRVTLSVDSVKLKPAGKPVKAALAPGAVPTAETLTPTPTPQ